jgi:hypothetical protein
MSNKYRITTLVLQFCNLVARIVRIVIELDL